MSRLMYNLVPKKVWSIFISMKKCNKCLLEKPITDFSKDKSRPDGYQYDCKACKKIQNEKNKEWRKEYYLNNKEKIKNHTSKWNLINNDKLGGGVYALIDKNTDKIIYIGQTGQLQRRKYEHNSKFKNNSNGGITTKFNLNPKNFEFIILHHIDDENERLRIEKELINTLQPKYNLVGCPD
jgi:predicted GIY-YIG superfamily endonuclease